MPARSRPVSTHGQTLAGRLNGRLELIARATHIDAAGSTTLPMHFYLFDDQHPELKDRTWLGPTAQRVVAVLERLDPVPTTRLIWGSVITHDGVYRLADLQIGGSSANNGGGGSFSYQPDQELYKTVVCDLAETLTAPPSTAFQDQLLGCLARGSVWAVGSSTTTDDQALRVDAELRCFEPYLGMVRPDLGNPLHRRLMVDVMYHKDIVLGPGGILYRLQSWLPPEDQEGAEHLAREFGSSKPPVGIESDDFDAALPPLVFPNTLSQRGALTVQRLAKKAAPSHRERLARAILDRCEAKGVSVPLAFSTAKAEGVREFELNERKFLDYLLNRSHPKGASKAKFFIDELGIEPTDWRFLADQIERSVVTAPLYRVNPTEWGFSHGALVLVTGRNNKTAVLETGWTVTSGGSARFVTAYPYDGAMQQPLAAIEPFIVKSDLSGDERWAAIYDRAAREAHRAAGEVVPTPVVFEGFGTEWEGIAGFGWVHLPSARDAMAKWLLKMGLGQRSAERGVKIWPGAETRSWERKRAWARAFAAVLEANGVKCSAGDRSD